MRAIESKQEFIQEYTSLLNDIEENIQHLSHYANIDDHKNAPELVEEINRLKLHRKKLQDALENFEETSEVEWLKVRPQIRHTFQKAEQEWQTIKVNLKQGK